MSERARSVASNIAKRDANEQGIVDALKSAGATVIKLSGKDIPDLCVGYCGMNYLLEVKSVHGRLEKGQEAFHAKWKGRPISTVRTATEALIAIGAPHERQHQIKSWQQKPKRRQSLGG